MSKIAVLDTHKRILEPCHPAVARRLLREGQAAVYKRYPFTIILKHEVTDPTTADYTLSIDPGSKCTIAITDSLRTTSPQCLNSTIAAVPSREVSQPAPVTDVADAHANSGIVPHAGKTDPEKPLYAPKQVGYTNPLDKAVKGGSHPV